MHSIITQCPVTDEMKEVESKGKKNESLKKSGESGNVISIHFLRCDSLLQ